MVRGRGLIGRASASEASTQHIIKLAEALLSGRGEASGIALARDLLHVYDKLPAERKLGFLKLLAQNFGPDQPRLERALSGYLAQPTGKAAMELHTAAESRRQGLIRRLNLAPGGTRGLVRMREDVLRSLSEHPDLEPVDADFTHLFSSWFNRGFLVLMRIAWSAPANILEKIIRYEAVHEIADWDDLRGRLEPSDRRCFAFLHPALVDEPLIFVEVALTSDVPGAIAPLLARQRKPIPAHQARTAVFYSISNCQPGLRGISFGNFLIKQVAEEMRRELPFLKTFVTLSPIPGFMKWLQGEREAGTSKFLTLQDKAVLKALDQPGWHADTGAHKALRPVLACAVAQYFLAAAVKGGRPLDPVARFHLGNGARLERINWLGDASPKGLGQAAGFMVNYLYDLDRIEKNHEAFANRGEIVCSHAVRRHLRGKPRAKS